MNNTIKLRNTTNEWGKHLRSFGKRVAGKKQRASGRRIAKQIKTKLWLQTKSSLISVVDRMERHEQR